MEASAVYTLARYRGVEAVMTLVVSDELWIPSGVLASLKKPSWPERRRRSGSGSRWPDAWRAACRRWVRRNRRRPEVSGLLPSL